MSLELLLVCSFSALELHILVKTNFLSYMVTYKIEIRPSLPGIWLITFTSCSLEKAVRTLHELDDPRERRIGSPNSYLQFVSLGVVE